MGKREKFSDVPVVESQHQVLIPEEFPDGPYGHPIDHKIVLKSSPWEAGQRRASAFTYENKQLHEGIPRQDPESHPPHDALD
ncbi:hypothetical protein L1765_00270 [Microaerobacter geothermalis]|uniref:hypothetical protein n=1 Tax=Microaerobacter geothermalis TaxID=674972 RepID=UPI001F2A97E2|nr:hypothetical protein [Microaerobacter geothermalis]MCF6092425.1 hypothetical protein [Microaerobacter geothermalis]